MSKLMVKCMVCGGREILGVNPKAADDLLALAARLLRECEDRHVLIVMSEEMAQKVDE